MLYFKLIITVFLTTFFLSACDRCRYLDCATDNFYGTFRIVSKTNGSDLVFGSTSLYDKKQIRFYSLKGTDTTFFDYQPISSQGAAYDSILAVTFFPMPATAFIRLSNGDIDTLALSYKTTDTKCCGRITEITKFVYNNFMELPGGQGTQELKK
jgi:hypothetical protein